AEDGIRDLTVTGVQTCALPIFPSPSMKGITGWSGTRSFPPWSSMGCAPLGICGLGLGMKAPVVDARTYTPARRTCLGLPKWIFRSEERRVGKECRAREWRE